MWEACLKTRVKLRVLQVILLGNWNSRALMPPRVLDHCCCALMISDASCGGHGRRNGDAGVKLGKKITAENFGMGDFF